MFRGFAFVVCSGLRLTFSSHFHPRTIICKINFHFGGSSSHFSSICAILATLNILPPQTVTGGAETPKTSFSTNFNPYPSKKANFPKIFKITLLVADYPSAANSNSGAKSAEISPLIFTPHEYMILNQQKISCRMA